MKYVGGTTSEATSNTCSRSPEIKGFWLVPGGGKTDHLHARVTVAQDKNDEEDGSDGAVGCAIRGARRPYWKSWLGRCMIRTIQGDYSL